MLLRPAAASRAVPAMALPSPSAAVKAEIAAAADEVMLRLDPGMHTAPIWRIAATADGRTLVTASDDKTVRLWALPEGASQDVRFVRTLRPVIGPGDEGKVNAVAIDPQGRWVAAGGWMSQSDTNEFVTIFDAATGAVTGRLGPMPNVVHRLAVSPDGTRLAAGLGTDGVRVWERRSDSHSPLTSTLSPGGEGEGGAFALAFEDWDYGGDVYGLAFAPGPDGSGRLAATTAMCASTGRPALWR